MAPAVGVASVVVEWSNLFSRCGMIRIAWLEL
jgi:hypothetical protein